MPRRFDSAHFCPFEGLVEGQTVLVREPLPALCRLRVDADRERRIFVAELLGDVDRIVAAGCPDTRVRSAQASAASRALRSARSRPRRVFVSPPDRGLEPPRDVLGRLARPVPLRGREPNTGCQARRAHCPCVPAAHRPARAAGRRRGPCRRRSLTRARQRAGREVDVGPVEGAGLPHPEPASGERREDWPVAPWCQPREAP